MMSFIVQSGANLMCQRLLTVKEVAEYLRVTTTTVRRWCAAGKLPAFQIGHQWRIDGEELERMIQARKTFTFTAGDGVHDESS